MPLPRTTTGSSKRSLNLATVLTPLALGVSAALEETTAEAANRITATARDSLSFIGADYSRSQRAGNPARWLSRGWHCYCAWERLKRPSFDTQISLLPEGMSE